MLQLKFGLSLATDLSFTRTNKVIECLDLVDKCIKGIRALSLYFSWSSFLDQKMKPSLTSQPAIAVFQNGPDFILLRSEIGPFWAKKVWEWSRFSLKKKNICSVTTKTQKPSWPLHAYWTPLHFKVPPSKWQLRVYSSCVLKSGTKMRLLSNSPV